MIYFRLHFRCLDNYDFGYLFKGLDRTPSVLFIAAFIILKTGKNQEGLNFFLSVGLQSFLIIAIGLFIVIASAITALKEIIKLKIPYLVKMTTVTIFAMAYGIIALVISAQGIARIDIL